MSSWFSKQVGRQVGGQIDRQTDGICVYSLILLVERAWEQ